MTALRRERLFAVLRAGASARRRSAWVRAKRYFCGRVGSAALLTLTFLAGVPVARADLEPRSAVRGTAITRVSFDGHVVGWEQLGTLTHEASDAGLGARPPARTVTLRLNVEGDAAEAVEVPVCAGRREVTLDGVRVDGGSSGGPLRVAFGTGAPGGPGAHVLTVAVRVSDYERRVACGAAPQWGVPEVSRDGLRVLHFPSRHAAAGNGAGAAVVYVPPGHDLRAPGPLLVGLHPWNGSMWSYAAYAELLAAADARDVLLLFPSGLGNSLYTAAAEDEVLQALDALAAEVAVDPRRIGLFGASMGGAGATTIGFHRPDRFSFVASFFGDAQYDLGTYVKSILRDQAGAHLVNAVDVADNARWLPVFLVHGRADHVSPIAESAVLAQALRARGFEVHFEEVPGRGHEGGLVAERAGSLVRRAAELRRVEAPPRVTYRGVRRNDRGAYGVTVTAAEGAAETLIDIETMPDGVHVHRADGVASVTLARGALGLAAPVPVVVELAARRSLSPAAVHFEASGP